MAFLAMREISFGSAGYRAKTDDAAGGPSTIKTSISDIFSGKLFSEYHGVPLPATLTSGASMTVTQSFRP